MPLQLSGSLEISGSVTAETISLTSGAPLEGTASWAINVVNGGGGGSNFATTGSNVFTDSQTIDGNLFMSGAFRLVYNDDPNTNMLFGQFDGSSIHGPYYQLFGNQYPNALQRGGAEFVYDTRNGGDSGFNVAAFDGSSWTRRFRVDDSGVIVTGSVNSTGGFTGSLEGTASWAMNVVGGGGGGSVQQFFYTSSTAPNSSSLETYFASEGTIYLVSQSVSITGSGTTFIGDSGVTTLDYWYNCFVYDEVNSKWWLLNLSTIDSDTLATIYRVRDLQTYRVDAQTPDYYDFPGTTGNYKFYIAKSVSTGYQAISFNGIATEATGMFSFAQGDYNLASGYASHVEGLNNVASADYSHAEGSSNLASGFGSHAEGRFNLSAEQYSHAEGRYTTSSGYYSHTEGESTMTYGNSSHAEGFATKTDALYAHAEGYRTYANGQASHAEGAYTTASGDYSHAEGFATIASGLASHAEGTGSKSDGESSHAEGSSCVSMQKYSHAEGYKTFTGAYAFAVTSCVDGLLTLQNNGEDLTPYFTSNRAILFLVDGNYGFGKVYTYNSPTFSDPDFTVQLDDATVQSVGHIVDFYRVSKENQNQVYVLSDYDGGHSEGQETVVTSRGSHAEGWATLSSAEYSHAEGSFTQAIGISSHAEGGNTQAYGLSSHAEGDSTVALGDYSHAEGENTQAIGRNSHAEGSFTQAKGYGSHAEGLGTIASGSWQHVHGQYNMTSSAQSAFIIGNGEGDEYGNPTNRSNLIFASGSEFQVTGSVSISSMLTLATTDPLPASAPTGSIMVSGSDANNKPYYWNGATWTALF